MELLAVDAEDAETGAHLRRVAAYALLLAEALALPVTVCEEIKRVALFHDIGKMHGVLFDIVRSPRRLTAADRKAIATHPDRGAQVLAPLTPFYPELPEGVRAHHERWDGTGYPRGLRGTDIPLASRVVAVVDTFDAITHSRRYHAGQPVIEGARALEEGRGTQFDATLVDAFLRPAVFERATSMFRGDPASERPGTAAVSARADERRTEPGHARVSLADVHTGFRWRP